MSTTEVNRIDELQAAVSQLANTLALSERRNLRLERMIRWGVLSMLLAMGFSLVILFQPLGYAIAQQAAQPSKSVEQAIDRLNENLTGQNSTIGQVGQMMYQMMQSGTLRAMEEAQNLEGLTKANCTPGAELSPQVKHARIANQLGFYAKCYWLERAVENPTPQQYQQAVMAAVTGTAVDMGVLVSRIRDDSDVIRVAINNYFESSKDILYGIGHELKLLNDTLESVPIMTANVNTMTHQMGIMAADMNTMSHSMGSTMGRMGNWMPW